MTRVVKINNFFPKFAKKCGKSTCFKREQRDFRLTIRLYKYAIK